MKLPKFETGQSIGIVNFSGCISADGLKNFVNFVTNDIGIKVHIPDSITYVHDNKYFGSDQIHKSIEEFHKFLRSSEIGLIIAASGGFGAQKIVNELDVNEIYNNPKPISGLSDITVVLNAITNYDIPTILGITAEIYNKEHKKMFIDLLELVTGNVSYPYKLYSDNFIRRLSYIDKDDVAQGIGIGGNMTMIETMIGTKYDISTKEKILFLEDVSETSYDIMRTLIHLDHAGLFNFVGGVVVGKFDLSESMIKSDYVRDNIANPSVLECLSEFFKNKKFPVLYGYPFSHNSGYNITIPLGVEYLLDYKNREVYILESLVD